MRGSEPDYSFGSQVKSGADFLREGGEAETPTTFHAVPGLAMSHTGRVDNDFRLSGLPPDEIVTVTKTVVCWSDSADWHETYIITAYLAGDRTAKAQIERILGTVELFR